jgi:hypothetical protein
MAIRLGNLVLQVVVDDLILQMVVGDLVFQMTRRPTMLLPVYLAYHPLHVPGR